MTLAELGVRIAPGITEMPNGGRVYMGRELSVAPTQRKHEASPLSTVILVGGKLQPGEKAAQSIADHSQGGMTIFTGASATPETEFIDYEGMFQKLGIKNIHHWSPETPRITAIQMLNNSEMLFGTGGNQIRGDHVMRLQQMTGVVTEKVTSGALKFSGTSANASEAGYVMPVGQNAQKTEGVAPGLKLIPFMVDTHVNARPQRLERDVVVAQMLHMHVIGTGENTAVRFGDGRICEVAGPNPTYDVWKASGYGLRRGETGKDVFIATLQEAA